jgi:hypothetical protein
MQSNDDDEVNTKRFKDFGIKKHIIIERKDT